MQWNLLRRHGLRRPHGMKLLTPTLTRLKAQPASIEDVADPREELARDASELLGYKKLGSVLGTGPLLAALRKLDIEPLVERTVAEYKAHKARPGMWHTHKVGYSWLTVALAAGITGPILAEHVPGDHFTAGLFFCIISFLLAVVGTIVGLVCRFGDVNNRRTNRRWERSPIYTYNGNVPEFALHKAVQIKREVPTCALTVEYLVEATETYTAPLPDPFLVVSLGSEQYYIEVWDEREYEEKHK